MSDEQKCPRCGSEARHFYIGRQRNVQSCDNKNCCLPVQLWDEWAAMKDQLDGRIREVGALNVAMRDLEDENARLTAIVDKLPKTKDGVSVCPGDAVYDPVDGLVYTVWEFFKHSGRWFAVTAHRTLAIGECYSTPEAAEAAKEVKT